MRNTNIQIEFYSDILEDDIILDLSVNYEVNEETEFLNSGKHGEEQEVLIGLSAQFLPSDVSILTDISFGVRVEFFDKFENSKEEIISLIEEEINN